MYFSICPEYCFYFMSLKGKSVQELSLHLLSLLEERRYGKSNEFLLYNSAAQRENLVKLCVIFSLHQLTNLYRCEKMSIHVSSCL